MYFDLGTFLRLAYLALFKWPKPLGHKNLLHPIKTILGLTIYGGIELTNRFCFLLDEFLYRGYRDQRLKQPVFIVGAPRSGTTLIHRLLAADKHNFHCFHTWEILFPAICQKHLLSLVRRIDRCLGNPLKRTIQFFENRLLHGFNRLHRVSLFAPEEDDKLLLHAFAFHGLVWLFPFPDELQWLIYFDRLAPLKKRRSIMRFYYRCIQRQSHQREWGEYFLSKNPFSSHKIDSLFEFFPDCRIIYMVRNPMDVIPSMLSMAKVLIQASANADMLTNFEEEVYRVAISFYLEPLERLEAKPCGSYALVNYDDLTQSPQQTIERLYAKFGLDLTEQYAAVLRQETELMAAYKSRHAYQLDDFSIGPDRIARDLAKVMERFGFNQNHPKRENQPGRRPPSP